MLSASTYAVEAAFVELSPAVCVATVTTAPVASKLALKVALPVILIAVDETVKGKSLPKPSLKTFKLLVIGELSPTLIRASYVFAGVLPVSGVPIYN